MDQLAPLLRQISLSAQSFFSGELCQLVDFDEPDRPGHIHILKSGQVTMTVRNDPPQVIERPSVLFFPRPCPHTLLGKGAGLDATAIRDARAGRADDPLTDALASLAVSIVKQRGVLSDADIERARDAGVDDGLIVEVIANVAFNTLTNYTNHIAATDIDFPVVAL